MQTGQPGIRACTSSCPEIIIIHIIIILHARLLLHHTGKRGKGSPYTIAERGVPELIPVLGSQPAGDVSHKPGARLPLLFRHLPSQPLRGLLTVSLLGEQRHDGCEQFA